MLVTMVAVMMSAWFTVREVWFTVSGVLSMSYDGDFGLSGDKSSRDEEEEIHSYRGPRV